MDDEDSIETACAQVNEGGVPAEDCCISELEDRPQQCRGERCVWMAQTKLVEVVDVRDAEVQWGQEDEFLGRVSEGR